MDVRELAPAHLAGYDCILHLAAISNDPMGELDTDITYSINQNASIQLAKDAKLAGVPRFLFSSSCSIYGQGETLDLDESASLNPQSAYARSKIEAEKGILALADDQFFPSCLRNATAYGYSPMLRLDLVVNNLLACAFTRGDIRIMSDGSPWRPLIHAKDIARAFIAFMEAPSHVVSRQAVNVGANRENYQVWDIGRRVQSLIPTAKVVYTGEVGADPRNYRVNFDLLYRLLPHFKLAYTLDSGMEELFQSYVRNKLSLKDFQDGKFVRLATLKKRSVKILEHKI
jgi:nucleoside-diphosphate-sugar epimerase